MSEEGLLGGPQSRRCCLVRLDPSSGALYVTRMSPAAPQRREYPAVVTGSGLQESRWGYVQEAERGGFEPPVRLKAHNGFRVLPGSSV